MREMVVLGGTDSLVLWRFKMSKNWRLIASKNYIFFLLGLKQFKIQRI